jgi:hypothetical protein
LKEGIQKKKDFQSIESQNTIMRVSLLVLGALPVLAYVYLFHLRALPLVIANGGDHLAAYYTSNSIDSVVVGPVQTRDDALNDDHVRIKVAFAALNPADKKLLGLPLACSSRPPHVCGLGIEGEQHNVVSYSFLVFQLFFFFFFFFRFRNCGKSWLECCFRIQRGR